MNGIRRIFVKNLCPHIMLIIALSLSISCGKHRDGHAGLNPDEREAMLQTMPYATVNQPPFQTDTPRLELPLIARNTETYRFKVGGHTSHMRCDLEEGYSSPRSIEEPIIIDHRQLAPGAIHLCILGGDSENGQPLHMASYLRWTYEDSANSEFLVAHAELTGADKLSLEITPPRVAVVEYRIRIAPKDEACETPMIEHRTFEANPKMTVDLIGGIYKVCVTAFDDLGNGLEAANSSEILIDVPVDIHVAFYARGSDSEPQLMYGKVRGVEERLLPEHITPLERRHGAFGRVGLLNSPSGNTLMVLPSKNFSIVGDEDTSLALAIMIPNEDIGYIPLITSEGLHSVGEQLHATSDDKKGIHIIHSGWTNRKASLTYTTVRGRDLGQQESRSLEIDETKHIQDAAIAVDAKNHVHIAIAQEGQLHYRTTAMNGISLESSLPVDTNCTESYFSSLAVDSAGRAHIAFLCSLTKKIEPSDEESESDESPDPIQQYSCNIMLASSTSGPNQSKFKVRHLATVDRTSSCAPFNSARPSVVPSENGVLVGFRTGNALKGKWGIKVVKAEHKRDRIHTVHSTKEKYSFAGFPLLDRDANGRIYLVYVADDRLLIASEAGNSPWVSNTLAGFTGESPVTMVSSILIGGSR